VGKIVSERCGRIGFSERDLSYCVERERVIKTRTRNINITKITQMVPKIMRSRIFD
jgi:hypothetical protein